MVVLGPKVLQVYVEIYKELCNSLLPRKGHLWIINNPIEPHKTV
jgi:hypothetical protein